MFRSRHLPLVTAAATVMLGAVTTVAPTAWAGGAPDRPVRCDDSLCIVAVNPISDRDGDGVSDVDEKAAGTDPDDPESRPSVLDLVELASKDALPSFSERFTEVIALPTATPDGSSLVQGLPAGVTTPTVRGGLERLGLSSSLMSSFGLDATLGVRVSADPGAMLGQAFGSGSRTYVGGMNVALVSAGDDLAPLPSTLSFTLAGLSANRGAEQKGADYLHPTVNGVTTWERHYENGSFDVQTRKKDGSVTQTSYDGDLNVTGSGTTTPAPTTTNSDGSTTTGSNTTADDRNNNTHTTSGTTTTKQQDGSSTTQTATTTVKYDNSGKIVGSTTVVTVTKTDANGASSTTTTASECSASGCSTPVTTTTTDDPDEYVNPDADTSVVWLTPDDVARIVKVATGSNTTPGPSEGVVVDEGWTPADPWGVVALVDPDQQTTTVYAQPRMPGAEPRTDPRLSELTGAITGGGCVRCPG